MSRISTEHARKLINNYADNKVGKVLAADDSIFTERLLISFFD